jgi:hypothetical protein
MLLRPSSAKRASNLSFTRELQTSMVSFLNLPKINVKTEPAEVMRKQNVPGPGTYKVIGMDRMGKYCVSNFK